VIDPAVVGVGAVAALLLLLLLGIPVAISLGITGFAGLLLVGGPGLAFSQIQNLPYHLTAQYAFAVVPLFVLMGNLALSGGFARELYDAADKWVGHLRGGLYLTTIAGSAAFGAASGSTIVNSTVFTRIALPEMLRLGYSKSLSSACIAAVGTLDAMIPPSVAMVVYGIITEQSIGQLMVAGIVPGILSALAYAALVIGMVQFRPELAPVRGIRSSWRERAGALRGTWAIFVLFGIVMGGIYFGWFAPSAAGAAGAFGALVIVALRLRLTWKGLWESLTNAAITTAMLFVIIVAGLLFSRMLVLSGLVTRLVGAISALELPPLALVVFLCLMYIVLGCLVDAISMLIVTLPFVFPLITQAQINPIWFGILAVQLLEIGAITPPVGLNLFATVSASERLVTLEDVIRGILPFVLLSLGILALLVAFPALALWLPGTMRGR
jgi:C4-dicarboxylate transporter DctM subunit